MDSKVKTQKSWIVIIFPLLSWLMKDVSCIFFKTKRLDITLMILIPIVHLIFLGYELAALFTAIIVVLVFHELGHLLLMYFYKYSNLKMSFYAMMALAQGEKERRNLKEELIIYLGGAIPGIVLGFLFLGVCLLVEIRALKLLGYYFIVINGFNLLPVYPLDGGRFVETLFCKRPVGKMLFYSFSLALIIAYQFLYFEPLLIIIGLFVIYTIADTYSDWRRTKRYRRKKKAPGFYGVLTKTERTLLIVTWSISISLSVCYYLIHLLR